MSLLSMRFSDLHLHVVECFYQLIMALVHPIMKLSYHVGGCCSFIPADPQEIHRASKIYTFIYGAAIFSYVAHPYMVAYTIYSIVMINVVYADSVNWTKGNF